MSQVICKSKVSPLSTTKLHQRTFKISLSHSYCPVFPCREYFLVHKSQIQEQPLKRALSLLIVASCSLFLTRNGKFNDASHNIVNRYWCKLLFYTSATISYFMKYFQYSPFDKLRIQYKPFHDTILQLM